MTGAGSGLFPARAGPLDHRRADYNNAQHTTETGTLVINCSGQEYRSGTATSYYAYDQDACINVR
jgi:hypothetical protein